MWPVPSDSFIQLKLSSPLSPFTYRTVTSILYLLHRSLCYMTYIPYIATLEAEFGVQHFVGRPRELKS